MTLDADTKLVRDVFGDPESWLMQKGVDSPRVRQNEEQTAQIENSAKLTSAESTLYRSFGDEVGVCQLIPAEAGEVSHKTHEGVILGEEQEMRVDVCTTNVRCQSCRCMWALIGLGDFAWTEELSGEANICLDTCHVSKRLVHYQAEKLSITL